MEQRKEVWEKSDKYEKTKNNSSNFQSSSVQCSQAFRA